MEETFRSATEDGLTVSLGFGDNDYKQSFSNHSALVYSADLLLGATTIAIPAYRAYLKLRGKGA